MTRLKTDWISDIEKKAELWDGTLRDISGMGYVELGAAVAGIDADKIKEAAGTLKVGFVSVTCGQGKIEMFAESVISIVSAMGFETFITDATDVDGMCEAYEKGADIIIMADENRYAAINTRKGKVGDNNQATGRGFVQLLDNMAGGLAGKKAAVLGYGIIGQVMADALVKKGAEVSVYDKDSQRMQLAAADGRNIIEDVKRLRDFRYVADGTSEGDWIHKGMLNEDVVYVSPGIPLSLDDEMREKLKGRYIHDLLETGTAVMVAMAL